MIFPEIVQKTNIQKKSIFIFLKMKNLFRKEKYLQNPYNNNKIFSKLYTHEINQHSISEKHSDKLPKSLEKSLNENLHQEEINLSKNFFFINFFKKNAKKKVLQKIEKFQYQEISFKMKIIFPIRNQKN